MDKLSSSAYYPVITCGYLILIQAASIPPYEPPNAMTGLSEAPATVDLIWVINSAKSARACSEVKYPRYFKS